MSSTLPYLLDTDMCIYLLNDNPSVKARVAQEGIETLAIATPTVVLIHAGLSMPRDLYRYASHASKLALIIAVAATDCHTRLTIRIRLTPPGPQHLLEPIRQQPRRPSRPSRSRGD